MKSWIVILIYAILAIALTIGILLIIRHYNSSREGVSELVINDVSMLNQAKAAKFFKVNDVKDIIKVILSAIETNHKVTLKGSSHSMGGQSVGDNSYVIDTTAFNKILNVNVDEMTYIVESGATWLEIIKGLNAFGLSPITLQSYSNFSVGGSISVNIHGITSDEVIANSVIHIEYIDSLGISQICSRNYNKEIFSSIIGGYGCYGVITFVKLRATLNGRLRFSFVPTITINDFVRTYQLVTSGNGNIRVKMARVNIITFENISLSYFVDDGEKGLVSDIIEVKTSLLWRFIYKWFGHTKFIQNMRYKAEEINSEPVDVNLVDGKTTLNQLLFESSLPITQLYSPFVDLNLTHILQEFFIDPIYFVEWMTFLKQQFVIKYITQDICWLLNLTIRYVKADKLTTLAYAKVNSFAFVFYYRLPKTKEADDHLRMINQILLTKTIQLGGSFYLPYRLHYTREQLETCYPFFKKWVAGLPKSRIFSNMWIEKYG